MSTPDPELSYKVIDYPSVEPAVAYAKLSSYTPNRPSFLLESLDPSSPGGRYSVVGYRIRRAEKMAPGMDGIRDWYSPTPPAEPQELAVALSRAAIGWLAASVAHREHGLMLCKDEMQAAGFMLDGAILLYDHHERRAVVAGRVKGRAVDRLIWELEHGPEIAAPAALAEGEPETVYPAATQDKMQARITRAQSFLDEDLEHLVMANTFSVPVKGATPLAVYRAWTQDKPSAHGFLLDFGTRPQEEHGFVILGHSPTSLLVSRDGREDGPAKLFAQLPAEDMLGKPRDLAAKVTRNLEQTSRVAWGGAVGYVTADKRAAIARMDQVVIMDLGMYWLTSGTKISEDTDPAQAPGALRQTVRDALRAIAGAQAAAPPEAEAVGEAAGEAGVGDEEAEGAAEAAPPEEAS